MLNCMDSAGGIVGQGPIEIVTGSSDGSVKLWDPRQLTPVLVLKPNKDCQTTPDCWAVSLGNSFNHMERCVASGYDNGDLKIFDLKANRLITDENVKNGICGLEFDRRDIKMNKLVVTGLEGRFYIYDL